MLEAKGLHKSYGAVTAVRGIDLRVRDGSLVGMVGNNGAGKTTTIKMLAGLVEPDAGGVGLDGQAPTQAAVRTRIGYLPEDSPLYDEQTAMAYLRFFGSLYGLSRREATARAETWLRRLRLDEEHWHKRIGDLSKGSARKVAIARCLLHDPDVLILDEPTSGLDPQSRRDLDDALLELKGQGKAILLSAHNLKQVEDLCDEVLVVHAGQIVTRGSIKDLRDRWGTTRYHVRADVPFPRSRPDGSVHVAAVDDWPAVEAVMDAVHQVGGRVLGVTSELPRLEDILARAAEA